MSAHNFKDLTGKTFNRLTVIKRNGSDQWGQALWECRCICGNITIVTGGNLRTNGTKSCGCLDKEIWLSHIQTHGLSKTPEYKIWLSIKQRCGNVNYKTYFRYGGRGIEICKEWKNDFKAFFHHVGQRPTNKHTIERIDNNHGYFPGNVKWATQQEQANNRRTSHHITISGIIHTIAQWARLVGVRPQAICCRLYRGWHPERAVLQPIRKSKQTP